MDRRREIVAAVPGVELVLDAAGKRDHHLDHGRAGDLVAVADADSWFTYYYWTDDARAPDFARTVDIHRKPGYDPAELFLDPTLKAAKAKVGWTLLKRKAGLRALMDVIVLDATGVRGSHGRAAASADVGPLLMTDTPGLLGTDAIEATGVYDVILRQLFNPA